VLCEGVLREERPALRHRDELDAAVLTAALADAGGAPDRDTAEWILRQLQFQFDGETTGQPRIVWGGPVADLDTTLLFGTPSTNVTATIAVWPSSGGGHIGSIAINGFTSPGEATGTWNTFRIGEEASLVAVPLQSASLPRPVVVATPPAAATVRLVSADGSPLAEAPVANQFAMLSVGTWMRDGLAVEAYNAAGVRIATAPVSTAAEGGAPNLVLNWD
jgi:hypothetical protein